MKATVIVAFIIKKNKFENISKRKERFFMKKVISIAIALVMVMSFAGCSLFSDSTLVKFDDTHTHHDPADLTYDSRIVLKNDSFGDLVEDYVNSAAYPDQMIFDEEGNMIGMYDYDAETGLAMGWTSLSDGKYTAYEEGKEVDLGKPDESKMIDIPGEVTLGCVVYGNEEKTVANYMYLFLTDDSAKDVVKEKVSETFGVDFEEGEDGILKCVQDAEAIEAEFQASIEMGYTVMTKNADAYAEILVSTYNARVYTGENPYKPFEDYEDPSDIEFDEKVVLVGAGDYAVAEEYVAGLSSMTDVLYGKDGKMVCHYTFYICTDKDAADKLENYLGEFSEVIRTSDTVVQTALSGSALEDLIISYKGYSVLNDDTVKDYTRMIEESFFSVVCE